MRTRLGTLSMLLLGVGILAASTPAQAGDAFPEGLVPGVALSEDELEHFSGKGVTDSAFTELAGGADLPRAENEEFRDRQQDALDQRIDSLSGLEDRLRAIGGPSGSGAERLAVTVPDRDSFSPDASDRYDALVNRAFAAEERTHWTIWR